MTFQNEQKILKQSAVKEVLKEILPIERDKAVSHIMLKMGFGRETAKQYLKMFFDCGIIKYDEKEAGVLIWNQG